MKVVDWLTELHDPNARKLTIPFLFGVFDYAWVVFACLIVAGIVNGSSLSGYSFLGFLSGFVLIVVPICAAVLGVCLVPTSGNRTRFPRWNYLACCAGLSAFIGWLMGDHAFFSTLVGALGGLTGMATFLQRASKP